MQTPTEPNTERQPSLIPLWLGVCLFSAIAVFFLWEEHKAHILGVLPYGLLGLAVITYLLLRGHGEKQRGPFGARR